MRLWGRWPFEFRPSARIERRGGGVSGRSHQDEKQAAAAPLPADDRTLYRGRLFRKYFALILALVCGTLGVSSAISLYFSYVENKTSLAKLQQEKAVSAAARIEQFVKQIEQQLASAVLPQLGADGAEQRRIEFLKLLRQAPAVTDIAALDVTGRELLKVSRLSMDMADGQRDRSKDPAFLGSANGKTYFSRVYFRKETEPYMTIALRSGGKNGSVTVAEVNLKFILDVVSKIRVGKKGKAYVIDDSGHLVADPDIGLVLKKTDLAALSQVKAALAGIAGAESGEQAMLAQDIAGREVLSAFATIDSLGWKVFVEEPVSEVYATLDASIVRTVILLIVGLLFSILAAIFLARSMVRPIRTLQQGAQRIGEGNLTQRIEVHTGDELEALAEQFNRMSVQLRESYAGLERKVEERTLELTETLAQQTATAEVLSVISGSISDVQPVFDAIVKSCSVLFDDSRVALRLLHGNVLRRYASAGRDACASGTPEEIGLDSNTVVGIAVLEARMMYIPEMQDVVDTYPLAAYSVASGYRSLLVAPLIADGRAIGSISIDRTTPGAFRDKEISTLQIFANQAVIAIENVRLFNEIQDKSRELEIANKHKSDFLANMSHELRTPLNAIIGFSEVLQERMFGALNVDQDEFVKDIHESGRHLLALINDILDLSKIEAGRMELDLAEFDLAGAIANALTLVKERAAKQGIALKVEVDPALSALHADERKFKQILLNLLSNAVKFTPSGGTITINARERDGGVEIAVADTGQGIALKDQDAVFEEFKQVGDDYARKAEGTGLGLALTKRFIELHGGRIRLQSELQKGSTFTFFLPNPIPQSDEVPAWQTN